jgi:membrane-associated phospholipid phosphatase
MKRMIACASLLTISVSCVQAQNFDINLLQKINSSNPRSQTYWISTSNSAYYAAPTLVMGDLVYGLMYKDKVAMKRGFESALCVGISIAISTGLKDMVNRPRPYQSYPDKIHPYSYTDGKSFPSGHTTLAFATATSLALEYKKWYITVPAFAWAASVGYSRMTLGKHYPTDVAAGAVIGIGSGYLSHWLTKKIFK